MGAGVALLPPTICELNLPSLFHNYNFNPSALFLISFDGFDLLFRQPIQLEHQVVDLSIHLINAVFQVQAPVFSKRAGCSVLLLKLQHLIDEREDVNNS